MPLLFHEATGGSTNTRNPWWAIALIVVSGAAYAGVIASRTRRLFGMALWLFTYLFMGLAPYVQYRLEMTPGTTPDVDANLYPAAGILLLACFAATGVGSYFGYHSRRPVRALSALTVNRLNTTVLSVIAVGLFLTYGAIAGFDVFLLTRAESNAYRETLWGDSVTGALLGGGMRMGLLVAFLAQMSLRYQDKAAGRRARWLPALVLGCLLLFVVNPINSPRYTFGTVALAMLAAFGAYATITRFRIMAVAALAGLLFIFPIADTFRRSTDVEIEAVGPVDAMKSGDFDAFSQLTNTLSYVGDHGITYGHQLLGVLLVWVPRSLWPGKPEATGIVLADHMNYTFTNLSAPIWAELLINFGWAGAILGMGAVGYWFRRWDVRTELHLRRYPVPPVVVSAAAFYMLILLRGSLLAVISQLLVILLASWYVTRGRSRKVTPEPYRMSQAGPKVVTDPDEPRNLRAPLST